MYIYAVNQFDQSIDKLTGEHKPLTAGRLLGAIPQFQ